ncbi:MAG: Mov34/MPN/PAD-1 family protein [Desulfurococcales archaeon]|nr:Mov34/MPN/PAD-1 family protein [Desulfurococcales archaeon]
MRRAEIVVGSRVLDGLEALALRSYPNEAIASLHGYIVSAGGSRLKAVISLAARTYIARLAATPLTVHFQLSPASLHNPSWIGMWHSHPNGRDELSHEDLETARSLARARGGPIVAGVTAVGMKGDTAFYGHVFKLVDASGAVLGEVRVKRARTIP